MQNLIKKTGFHIVLISLILLALGWYIASFDTFFSSDTGLRFMQVRQLIDHGWRTFAIDYPQQILDPNLEHVPYYYAYSLIDSEIYFDVSHVYPLLVSFFYSFLGKIGLPIVAVTGTVLTAVAIYKLAKLTNLPRPQILLWVTVFATPMLFYSLELWDHTLAAACGAWAVYGVAKALVGNRWQPAFWSGLVAGFGLAQRPEMYLFTLVLGLAVLIFAWRRWRLIMAFIVGGVISTFIIWGLQYIWVGHPFGMAFAPHFFGYGVPQISLVEPEGFPKLFKFSFLLFYVQPDGMLTFVATLLILLGIILIVFSLRQEKMRKPTWLMAGGIACLTGYILLMYYARNGLIPGIISTFPLIGLSLAYVDDENGRFTRIHQFIYFVTLLFLGGMILVWPALGGRQWGARYLLPAYPLLVFLAYYTYATMLPQLQNKMQNTLRFVAVSLLITSVFLQVMGVRALSIMRQSRVHQHHSLATLSPTYIVTDQTQGFVPSVMSTLADKQFLQTGDEENKQALFSRLQDENIPEFVFLMRANEGVPALPDNSCYQLQENLSVPECGRGSSCWVFQLSTDCN